MILYIPFFKTIQYLQGLYGVDSLPKISIEILEKNKWSSSILSNENTKNQSYICTREEYLKKFTLSPDYFIDRGFSLDVLQRFDVRMYPLHNRNFSNRCVCPTFDISGRQLLGVQGRAVNGQLPKWLNSDNFPVSTSLYGLWLSADFIRQRRHCILVESAGNLWRLWEAGIFNVCALYGGIFTPAKSLLLDRLGVMKLTLVMDNDPAGAEHAKIIVNKWSRVYNIQEMKLPVNVNDIAELSIEQIIKLELNK